MTAWKSSMELGDLIATTPGLLSELERFADAPWVQMPRGRRVRLKKAIAAVRADLGQATPLPNPTVQHVPSENQAAYLKAIQVEDLGPSSSDSLAAEIRERKEAA